jgi:hypothetical protein
MISALRRGSDVTARERAAGAIMRHMTRTILIAALLVWSLAVVHADERATTSSDGLGRAIFCSSPKDHSDCLAACGARLEQMQRYRACTAACTSLYCPSR